MAKTENISIISCMRVCVSLVESLFLFYFVSLFETDLILYRLAVVFYVMEAGLRLLTILPLPTGY